MSILLVNFDDAGLINGTGQLNLKGWGANAKKVREALFTILQPYMSTVEDITIYTNLRVCFKLLRDHPDEQLAVVDDKKVLDTLYKEATVEVVRRTPKFQPWLKFLPSDADGNSSRDSSHLSILLVNLVDAKRNNDTSWINDNGLLDLLDFGEDGREARKALFEILRQSMPTEGLNKVSDASIWRSIEILFNSLRQNPTLASCKNEKVLAELKMDCYASRLQTYQSNPWPNLTAPASIVVLAIREHGNTVIGRPLGGKWPTVDQLKEKFGNKTKLDDLFSGFADECVRILYKNERTDPFTYVPRLCQYVLR